MSSSNMMSLIYDLGLTICAYYEVQLVMRRLYTMHHDYSSTTRRINNVLVHL